MIEPTETETRETLDRFVGVMRHRPARSRGSGGRASGSAHDPGRSPGRGHGRSPAGSALALSEPPIEPLPNAG